MVRNYFKIAWRNIKKNGFFSVLNLFGLSVGLAIFLYLFLFTKQELSFDSFHKNYKNIAKVGVTATFGEEVDKWGNVPNIVGPTFAQELPEVKAYSRFLAHSFGKTAFINVNDKKFTEKNLMWTDPGVFDIFDIPMLQGNAATALDAPNKLMISKSTAEKYFGSENPVGKTISIDHQYDVIVSGVYADFPANSTLQANMLGSFTTMEWASKNLHWSNASYETYVLLNPNTNMAALTKKAAGVLDKYVPKNEQWFSFWFQPFEETHLYSTDISNQSTSGYGDKNQVNILIGLALGILLIACINYMNLATAQSQKNQKEVGISKVMGATQSSLITRFYVEAFLMVSLAMTLGIVVFIVGLPLFNYIASNTIGVLDLLDPMVLVSLVLITLVLTLLAGSYPALMISSFSPLSLFGRKEKSFISAEGIRKSLVVLQFSASIVLIISTIVFFTQLNFIQNKKLGFDVNQVVSVSTEGAETSAQINALINNLKGESFIKSVSRAQTYPGASGSGRTLSMPNEPEKVMSIQSNFTSPDVFETLNIPMLAGKAFEPKTNDQDTTVQVVVNKTAIDFYGFTPEEAIGKTAYNLFGWNNAKIVGVVADFHFEDFHKPIGAYAFHNHASEGRPNLLIRCEGGNIKSNLGTIESLFKQSIPNSAFEYTFLDDFTAKLYESDKQTYRIVLFFSLTAILIACLGLFGLAAYTAEQRIKEIGVRKVLGASVSNIVGHLSKDFLKLVFISILIATPVAWYFVSAWLSSFAFHVDMPWWAYGVAGILAIFMAFATVSYQSLKAAMVNRVKSLKSE